MSRSYAKIAKKWLVAALLAAGALAGAEAFLRARHRRSAFAAESAGLRPESAGLQPRELAGHLRVVALGDSITHGMQLPAAQTYVGLLAERLRARLASRPVTVTNAGICGQTAVQGLARLERDVLRFRPALTLISFGLNDASPSRSEQDAAREAELAPMGLGRLHLVRTLRARRHWVLAAICPPQSHREHRENPEKPLCGPCDSVVELPGRPAEPRVSPGAFRAALTEMVRRIRRETGGEVVLLTTHLPGGYNAIIRQVAGESGAGLVDVERTFAGCDAAGLLECDGVHLTAQGQRLLADAVFSSLAKVLEPSQGC